MTQWQAYHQVVHHLAILSLASGDQGLWGQWGQWDQWGWDQGVLVGLAGVHHLGAQEDLLDHGGCVLLFPQE